ncbi:hypothetical protein JCM8208_007230 [Rhodotorula glutinis]
MLRLSSYGASSTTSHGYPKSPLEPARQPPAEAFPPPPAAKSSDVLINRGHQLKRIARDTATFYQGIAEAHNSHALTLKKLSHPSTTPIATPFSEASLFIPLPPSSSASKPASPGADAHDAAMSLGGNGSEGWQQILQEARDTNLRTADAHHELAKRITKDVVGPLLRCRVDLKQHLALMEKDLGKHVDAVQKERDTAAPLLARLSTSLTQSSLPLSAPSLAPLEDPVLLRAQLEAQLRLQVVRENDLLAAVKLWSDRTEVKERDTFVEIKRCWAAWEQANSSMLLGNQQQSMFLSATVDSVPPDGEWHHFLRLNHLVLPDTRPKTLDDVVWDGKGDVLTTIVREGLLERQTSILKSWKPAYFILTPSGHLHIYGPPPATVTATSTAPASSTSTAATAAEDDTDSASLSSDPAAPASTTAPSVPALTPSAQHLLLHSSPHLSLNLALCTLGPMPTPAPAPSPNPDADPAAQAKAAKKKQPLDAVFTLIETLGKGGKGEGSGARHVVRCKGVDGGWEEMGGWVASIGKFCAPPTAPPPPASPPTPTAPVVATLPVEDDKLAADPAARSPAHTPLATPRSLPPPFAPAAAGAGAGLAAGASALSAAGPPALPDRPPSATSFFSSSAEPPALPPRDAAAAAAPGLPSFDSFTSLDSPGLDEQRNSVLVIDDDYDMSRAMGALGVGAAVGAAVAGGAAVVGATGAREDEEGPEREEEQGPPPPEKGAVSLSSPRHDDHDDDAHSAYGDDADDGASDAGDLGRSLSQSSLNRHADRADRVERKERPISPRQGSVRSLAQAWEQQQQGSGAGSTTGAEERKPAAGEEEYAAEDEQAHAQVQQLDVPGQQGNDELDGASDMGDTSFGDEGEVGQGLDEAHEGDKPAKPAKKGKKKRKSKAGAAKPTERPLPLPSVDPEHADLGLPSPHSPSFADAQPLAHDDANLHADSEGVSSPPPMVLEEVDEAPSRRSSEERERVHERENEGEGKKEGEGA